MLVFETKKELQKKLMALWSEDNLGLVPTMGALHEGHASLIRKALDENTHVIVSIFVNPTQFNNTEDLEKYPQTLSADVALIKSISDDILIFTPTINEVYGKLVTHNVYDFQGLDKVMEGRFRDNHFNGVGTIVELLLTLIKPTRAYFGEKDFQQLRIIQKLTKLRNIPVKIIGCPIVREPHGLAMSSRNERLNMELRQKAGFIYETLIAAKDKFGTENALQIKKWAIKRFKRHKDLDLEYIEIVDIETLVPAEQKTKNKKYRAFIAVYAGGVRLIDNIALN
ncbi:pantoate--beta-alanine ligase [Maribacter sp. 2304DJ31-5]|uniref:pantoate--beta-alanine ligase n=1 Tax=Maribacter sp. 2304DJ31-5 TaxID=3386273 RepID=UPI0039BD4325